MKKDELYKDQGLRQALQHRNEVAKKLTPSADFADSLMARIQASEVAPQSKRRRLWTYVSIGAVAASIVLLLSVGIHLIPQQGGEPILMAQTDTIKAEPKNATYLDTYAWILFMEGRYSEAKIYIDQALQNLEESESNDVIREHAEKIKSKLIKE